MSLSAIVYAMIVIGAILLEMHIWQRRAMPGGKYFSFLLAAISFWAFMCMIEYITANQLLTTLATRLEYVSVTWAGPLWLLFVLDYGYRSRWPISAKMRWLWAIPVIVSILALTNDWHGLIWPRTQYDLTILGHGLGLWVNLLYTYVLMLAGFVLMLRTAIGSYKNDHVKAVTLLFGTMLPVASSILYMGGLDPELLGTITPMVIATTILIYAWCIFRQRLFQLVPVAREVLVRSMADGILVLDKDGRLVDQNPAAMKMLGTGEDAIDMDISEALSRWPDLADRIRNPGEDRSEIRIDGPKAPVWLEVQIAEIDDGPGKFFGRLVSLRNITRRKVSEKAIQQSNESLMAEVAERKQVEEALKTANSALQAEIAMRRRTEENLAVSLKEKELLLKEIHHRVKNNLQIISSLMSLQIATMSNDAASASLKESQNRIKSMALIHEQLYQSRDLASIDIKSYVESLIVFWTRSYVIRPGLTIRAGIEDISLDIDTAIPCGLIINELISNSLKYAFTDRDTGTIEVALARDGGAYRLSVSDDGIGLPQGFDFRNTTSLGMQLVVTLADQLNGSIEHPDGPGTTFIITFNVGDS